MAAEKLKRPSGGQTKFDPKIAIEVCELVSSGMTLTKATKQAGVPRDTFINWINADRDGLAVRYARARADMFEVMADELIDLSDETAKDRTNIPVNRNRLQIDTRKWLLSKLLPEKYGELLKVEQKVTKIVVKETPAELDFAKEEWERENARKNIVN